MSYLTANIFDDETYNIVFNLKVNRRTAFNTIRLGMVKSGILTDGTLLLEVKDKNRVLATASLTYEDFNSVSEIFQGFISFELNNDNNAVVNLNHNEEQELTISLTMTGHTESDSAYLGLVRSTNPFVGEYGDRPASTTEDVDMWFNPYNIELFNIVR